MITLQTVQTNLLTAQLKVAQMVDKNVLAEMGGSLSTNWKNITKATRGINVINWKLSIGDITSPGFQSAYACLLSFIGTTAGGTINPNAQNPGTVIDVVSPIPQPLTFTEANLVDADPPNGQWYLPWTSPYTPVAVSVNGVSFTFQFNQNIANGPIGIYGFSNNNSQVIIVTIV